MCNSLIATTCVALAAATVSLCGINQVAAESALTRPAKLVIKTWNYGPGLRVISRKATFGAARVGACHVKDAFVSADGSVVDSFGYYYLVRGSAGIRATFCTQLIFLDKNYQRVYHMDLPCSDSIGKRYSEAREYFVSIPPSVFRESVAVRRLDNCHVDASPRP
jgi:hypothetical protein